MAVEKNRKYSVNTEKLQERVKKVYESGNSSRMEKIRKELTKAGDTESILTVGTSFLLGKNLPADRPQALAWLRLAAQNGNPEGQFHYAWMLDAGNTADPEGLSAASWYLKAASGGNRQAMFMLACACFTGQGPEQSEANANAKEGQSWKRKADLKDYEIHELIEEAYFCGSPAIVRRIRDAFPYVGDVVGATMIGDAISSEIIRGQDHEEAIRWYRTAAEIAVPGEQCLIAKQLEDGTGITADLREAIHCYEMAAEGGNTESMRLLGILADDEDYPEGKKAPVRSNEEVFGRAKEALEEGDHQSAVRIAMRLAMRGMPQAQYMVARICEEGKGGLIKDYRQALDWYRKAADQNYAPACYRVAWYYDRGRAVREDPVEAFRWYQKAAYAGSPRAANHLANAYMEGRGVRTDREAAFSWYQTSAQAGNAAAMYNLSVCLRDGEGTNADLAGALVWARRAMENGSSKAPSMIDTVMKKIEEAAEKGETGPALALGRIYETGSDLAPADEAESLRWYKLAADSGDPAGLIVLGRRSLQAGDEEAAQALFQRAAAAGDRDGMFYLASRYAAEGKISPLPCEEEAWTFYSGSTKKELLEHIAEDAYSEALTLQLQKEYDRAYERFSFAALLGHAKACAHTGRLSRLGKGTEQDTDAAVKWLKKAFDAGQDTSFELFEASMQKEDYQEAAAWANTYEEKHGDGKARRILLARAEEILKAGLDDKKARRERAAFVKFRQAARMGLPAAWLQAGEMYLDGRGVGQNASKAAACFRKAGEGGEQKARSAYARLYYEEGMTELDGQKAFAWLQEEIFLAKVGDTFSFGNYYAVDETDPGWRILWRVLEKTESELTAVSEYVIDAVPWQDGLTQVQWAGSALRHWLNHDFVMFAFSSQERILLKKAAVQTEDNPDYGTSAGPACYDRVSLLSMEEALRYFTPAGESAQRHVIEDPDGKADMPFGVKEAVWYDPCGLGAVAGPTPFAIARGAGQEEETGGCSWWLRSPGCAGGAEGDDPSGGTGYAAYVMTAGEIYSLGDSADSVKGLRPVIRLIRQTMQ